MSQPKAKPAAGKAGGGTGAAAYEAALMRTRIEAVRRLKDQFADPCSVASQAVAAYSDLLDGALPMAGPSVMRSERRADQAIGKIEREADQKYR